MLSKAVLIGASLVLIYYCKANTGLRKAIIHILLKASAKNSRSYYLTRGLKRVARPWGVMFISLAFDKERQIYKE